MSAGQKKPKPKQPRIEMLPVVPALTLKLPAINRVHLTLVGCGGTGSHIASGLLAIMQALSERGVASELLLVDPDIVEPKNVGRQLFSAGDVGRPKARVLAERLAAAFNMPVGASVRRIDSRDTFIRLDALSVVIGAVDNAEARATLSAATYLAMGKLWWLDTGNENHSGQACLGNAGHAAQMAGAVALGMTDRLPAPNILYPDLVNVPKKAKASKNGHRKNGRDPSCAELAAAGEQGLMVNRMAAAWALGLLHDFLLGELHYFGVAFSLQHGSVRTWPLDLPSLSEATGLSPRELEHRESKAEARG